MNEKERVQSLLKENGLVAKKSFGQNFLINDGIIRRIVKGMEVEKYPCVIEIGPGLGSLTLPLSKVSKRLIAVDADRDMAAVLKDLFQEESNVTVINSDFLRFNPDEYVKEEERIFVGNLPYNITSELLEYLIEKGFASAGVMVQKEVAEKLIYEEGKKENCPLGAFLATQGKVEILTYVDSSCFLPAPKVDSAFLKITKERKIDFHLYPIYKALFKDPNKNISNCLKQSKYKERAIEILKEKNPDALTMRARQLPVKTLLSISQLILENDA